MRPMIAAALAASIALAGVSAKAEAARLVIGVGLPGIAVVAPAPLAVVPAPFVYGPTPYVPYAVGPVYAWRAHFWGGYARPYAGHRRWR